MFIYRPFRLFLGLLILACFSLSSANAGQDPKMQILFVGADPDNGAPGVLPPDLPVIEIDALPQVDLAQQAIFAARLRSNPVSTFVLEPSETHAQFEQFYLVSDVVLISGEAGYRFGLGADEFALAEFADRMSAVVQAFNPKYRRIGFLRVTDPDDMFPLAIGEVQIALNRIGFDMMVVMIEAHHKDGACSGERPQALHYSLVSGLADRAPFGDADGVSTSAEVEAYLTRALSRQASRDPVCGPKYSLIIKSSNDPGQALVAYDGRSAFSDMETRLYNETFEAKFLMKSDDKDSVREFLTSCLYCPNEPQLNDHLRDMEEFARTSALEAEIWQRIKDDALPDRLAIYLENCSLCAFRTQVEDRITEIDAKARAFDKEEAIYKAALSTRDLDGLRGYVADCVACANVDEANQQINEIEADDVYMAEQASLAKARGSRDVSVLQAYLGTCQICEGRTEIESDLAYQLRRQELSAPCLSLAAVPQLGGPRKLEAIDQDKARGICAAVAQEFPEDGLVRTVLGRIAQAGGDFETARVSYDFGMQDDVPSAFGLAAYSHYAPPQGGQIDLAAAEDLARKGADRGDWLSQEILTVLYSKDLVQGKTAEDAFRIAEGMANEGNALAQFFVGYYYLTGTGIEIDADQAAVWLGKSVDQGYTHAYSFLAELHEKGTGTALLPDKAADLYWDALKQGDPTATDRLTTQLKNRNREVIRIIQQKLRDQGVYRGSVDGIAGPGTIAAVRRYADTLTEQG